jgi:D-alanyl-D-alanine carboxypeptidase
MIGGLCRRCGLIGGLIGLLLAALVAAGSGRAAAGPALVFDTGSGEVLHAYMASRPWYPASLTKLMTAYVTFGAIVDGRIGLDSTVTIPTDTTVAQPAAPIDPGATFTLEEALPLLLAVSSNVTAEAIAITVSGSQEAFVAEMNETAKLLGMADTAYVNPHGWYDPRHVTSARDLAVLASAMIRDFPEFQRFFVIESVRLGDKELRNHNGLLGHYPGVDGLKTGFHCESGNNIVATATRDGRRLAAIVLGVMTEPEREAEAAKLLNAGFAAAPGGSAVTIDALPRASGADKPVDMRPYVCANKKLPAELAGFGTMAPLPRAKP